MKATLLILTAFAGVAAVSGCSVPLGRLDLPARNPGTHDVGTPPSWIAQERKPRYYIDERGIVWDDQGRRRDAATLPLAGQPQDSQPKGIRS